VSRDHAIACAECRSLLGGYVLDALEPGDTDAVRAHVATCAECSREHAGLAALPDLLDLAGSADAEPAKPPPALEDAVLDRFARERRPAGVEPSPATPRRRPGRVRGWLTRPLPVAAAAATAAALATLAVTAGLDGSDSSTAHAYDAWLRGSAAAPGARAYAKLSNQAAGTRVDLSVRGMRATPGAVYELWCVGRGGTRVSAGTFRVDGGGRARVRLTTAARLGEYDRLSVERLGAGSPGEPVMAGSIEY
jgi:Anti-sigma-K factor rskA/Putative zinc-finger